MKLLLFLLISFNIYCSELAVNYEVFKKQVNNLNISFYNLERVENKNDYYKALYFNDNEKIIILFKPYKIINKKNLKREKIRGYYINYGDYNDGKKLIIEDHINRINIEIISSEKLMKYRLLWIASDLKPE